MFHQLVVISSDSLLQFFELNIKNTAKYSLTDLLLTYPVYSSRFECSSVQFTMLGYLFGDDYGRVFAMKICRN